MVSVSGSVTVANALLSVAPGFTAPVGQVFTVVENDGSDAIVGTLAGLPQGATFTSGGQTFRISYAGGTGNDITLTAAATGTRTDQTITFAALPNRALSDAPFTVSATASSGLQVTFYSQTPSVCTVSGSTVALRRRRNLHNRGGPGGRRLLQFRTPGHAELHGYLGMLRGQHHARAAAVRSGRPRLQSNADAHRRNIAGHLDDFRRAALGGHLQQRRVLG